MVGLIFEKPGDLRVKRVAPVEKADNRARDMLEDESPYDFETTVRVFEAVETEVVIDNLLSGTSQFADAR